jgi:hypothetical protein
MRNVTIDLGDGYSLSLFQSDVTGLVEVVPIYESTTEGGLIGEPVYLRGAEELIELTKSALDRDFAIWENQYYIELERELVQDNNQIELSLVVDNEEDKA